MMRKTFFWKFGRVPGVMKAPYLRVIYYACILGLLSVKVGKRK